MSPFVFAPAGSSTFQAEFAKKTEYWGSRLAATPGCLAVVLGGGYGRGDGGVTVDPQGQEHPYNDLDLFAVFEDRSSACSGPVQSALSAIRAQAAEDLGIGVDLGRPLIPADLGRLPSQLMWIDLAAGHRVLAGDPTLLVPLTTRLASQPPARSEAVRLLLNRAVGLLLSRFVLAGRPIPVPEPVDPGFVVRNIQKAYLAVLDATLILEGRYVARCASKLSALAEISVLPEPVAQLRGRFQEAIGFKHRPDLTKLIGTEDELERAVDEVGSAFLALEGLRLENPWPSPLEYAADRRFREPELHGWGNRPAHLVRNVKLGLAATDQRLNYPREALYRALVLRLARLPGAQWPKGLRPWAQDDVFFGAWARYN